MTQDAQEKLVSLIESRYLTEYMYGKAVLSIPGIVNPSTSKDQFSCEMAVKTDVVLFESILPELIILFYAKKFNLSRPMAIGKLNEA